MPDTNETKIITVNGVGIQARLLDAAEQLDLYESCGDLSGNSAWVNYATILCTVRQIGELSIAMPTSKAEVKAIARRLGVEGVNAVAMALYGGGEAEKKAGADADTLEMAKN